MTDERSFHGLPHRVTHHIPGVPAHAERPAGHQARARRAQASSATRRGSVIGMPSGNWCDGVT